jgi:hypothetical protein
MCWHASAVEAAQQSVQHDGSSDEITQTERAVFGQTTAYDVRSFLDSYVRCGLMAQWVSDPDTPAADRNDRWHELGVKRRVLPARK